MRFRRTAADAWLSWRVSVVLAFVISALAQLLSSRLTAAEVAPFFALQPTNVTVACGTDVMLEALAEGDPVPSYQWFYNGSVIIGASDRVLRLPQAQPAHSGIYRLQASNPLGTNVSDSAHLLVKSLPAVKGAIDPNFAATLEGAGEVHALGKDYAGRWLAAGDFNAVNGQARRNIARFEPDGRLDGSFLVSDPDGPIDCIGIESGGQILISGSFTNIGLTRRPGLARLQPTGELDMEFAPDLGGWAHVTQVLPVAGGRMLIAGWFSWQGLHEGFWIARLDPNGAFDSTFVASPVDGPVRRLCLQPDGSVLVAGEFTSVESTDARALARLNANGTVDATFNPGFGELTRVESLLLLPDGKLLAGGSLLGPGSTSAVGLMRLNRDGTIDPDFDGAYQITTPTVQAIGLLQNGELLVGGDFSSIYWSGLRTVALLWPRGYLDHNFSLALPEGAVIRAILLDGSDYAILGGQFLTANGEAHNGLLRIYLGASLAGPRITSAPTSRTVLAGTNSALVVEATGTPPLRYQWLRNATPLLEATNAMLLLTNLQTTQSGQYQVAVTDFTGSRTLSAAATLNVLFTNQHEQVPPQMDKPPRGATRFAGQSVRFEAHATSTLPLTWEWTCNGTLVPNATNSVLQLVNLQPAHAGFYRVRVAHAHRYLESEPFYLTVLPAPVGNGCVDVTFDPLAGGSATGLDSLFASVGALLIQPDGKLLVGGDFTVFQGVRCAGLVRLTPDGAVDPEFRVSADGFGGSVLALQPDGKILVGFDRNREIAPGQEVFGVVRLNADGTLDPTFLATNELTYSFINALAVQLDGKVLLGGVFYQIGGEPYRCVARLNTDGSLDRSFHRVPLSSDGEPRNAVNSIVLQPDGKILLFGAFGLDPGPGHDSGRGLVRLNADGTVDTSFHLSAHVYSEASGGLALEPDGRMVASAHIWDSSLNLHRNLARFFPDGHIDFSFNPPEVLQGSGALARLPDGSFVVATNAWTESVLMRVNQDGQVDPTFVVRFSGSAHIAALAVQSGGELIIGGRFDTVNGFPVPGLARLLPQYVASFVTRDLSGWSTNGHMVSLRALPPTNTTTYLIEELVPSNLPIVGASHGGVFDPTNGVLRFGPFSDNLPRTLTYTLVIPPWGTHDLFGSLTFGGTATADDVVSAIGGNRRLVVAGFHPADVEPADGYLSEAELLAYAGAWRANSTWPQSDNAVPISYVTRAAALRQSGGCYVVDSQQYTTPLWWTSCPIPGQPAPWPPPTASISVLRRHTPPTFVPGESLPVQIEVVPASNTMAYAIIESVASDRAVVDVSHDGIFHSTGRFIVWGPFYDGVPRTVRYAVTMPTVYAGYIGFWGIGSFNGENREISGPTDIPPGCRLQWGTGASGEALTLSLSGYLSRYRLEISTNLQTWSPWIEITNTTGRFELTPTNWNAHPQLFFRACRVVE